MASHCAIKIPASRIAHPASPYSLDPAAPTIYIKRVLRPFSLVALSLAALTPAFGQVRPIAKSPKVEIRPPTSSNTISNREVAQVETTSQEPPAPTAAPPAKGPGAPDSTVTLQYPNSDV